MVQDYYRGHKKPEELSRNIASCPPTADDGEKQAKEADVSADSTFFSSTHNRVKSTNPISLEAVAALPIVPWYTPHKLWTKGKYYFFRGVDRDVVAKQMNGKKTLLTGDLSRVHAQTAHFDNKTKYLYSFLQVLTAAVASFAHGSNDASNAFGLLSAIFLIWNTGTLASKSPIPLWVLV